MTAGLPDPPHNNVYELIGSLAAVLITDETFEKMVLMLVATPGMIAPAATATKPAIRAYSMRSWPFVSFQI